MLANLITYLFLILSIHAKIFLIGGGSIDDQSQIFDAIAKQTGKKPYPSQCSQDWTRTNCPKILVATSAAANEAAGNQAYNIDQEGSLCYKNLFIKYGFSPKHLSIHIDNYIQTTNISSTAGQQNLAYITDADAIFFNGGDQSRHVRCWFTDQSKFNQLGLLIQKRYNDGLVLIGTSAGSMTMGPLTYGEGSSFGHWYFAGTIGLAHKNVKDGQVNGTGLLDIRNGTHSLQYEQNGGFLRSFQIVPFLVDTHFGARGRLARIVPALLQIHLSLGVGIDESTCFYYHNGLGKVFGKTGVYITDISQITSKQDKYFSAQKIKMHYLTSGDSFDFKKKSVISSKQLITNPYYSGHYDSSDLLNKGQIQFIATRLIDQTASYNIGYAVTPSYFPRNTPKFKIIFSKKQNSKGYYSSKKYTVENIELDYRYE